MAVIPGRPDILPPQKIPKIPGLLFDEEQGPATPSADHNAMHDYWEAACALLDGLPALIDGGETFLPKHPQESGTDYEYRKKGAVLTNIFKDIVGTLAAKPFSREAQIIDGSAGPEFIGEKDTKDTTDNKRRGGFIEDVDGKGNHMHVFASHVFYHGIAAALDWIFVDYPEADANLTAGEEQRYNIRPYWFRIPAWDVLDVDSVMVGGKEVFIYFRYRELTKSRNGFVTTYLDRIREIRRAPDSASDDGYGEATFTLYEKDPNKKMDRADPLGQYNAIKTGKYTVGVIPVVPFIAGRRRGSSWAVDPPMETAARLQIELYRMETGLKNITDLVCYPMLSAVGVRLTDEQGEKINVTIGPHTILNIPPDEGGTSRSLGSWQFVEPNSQSLMFLATRIKDVKDELRELGKQPLTAGSGNLTVITTAFASDKANSAVQAWALLMKDALENALAMTAKWLRSTDEPEVQLNLDYLLELDDVDATTLRNMRSDKDLSQDTYWRELKRHGILSPEFDPEEEVDKLAKEVPSEDDLLAAYGAPPSGPNAPPKQPATPIAVPSPARAAA